jgi:hypothetical protein
MAGVSAGTGARNESMTYAAPKLTSMTVIAMQNTMKLSIVVNRGCRVRSTVPQLDEVKTKHEEKIRHRRSVWSRENKARIEKHRIRRTHASLRLSKS